MRILVAYASADGSTGAIARRIAEHLRERGDDVSELNVRSAGQFDVGGFDAAVIGSAVHSRRWLAEAVRFVDAQRDALRRIPVWTFSVGMPDALPRRLRRAARAEEQAILTELGDLHPRDHRLFSGVVHRSQFPVVTRAFLRLSGVQYGDHRDWPAIDHWAADIGDQLHDPGRAEASQQHV